MVDPVRRFEFAEPLPVIPPGKLPFFRYNLPMADATWTPLQHKLRETLALGDCPLCRLVEQDEQAFLRSLTYERILDIPTRETLQQARGLCAPHARAWRAVQGCALPVALVYRPIIKDLLAQTEPKTAAGWLSRPRSWMPQRHAPPALWARRPRAVTLRFCCGKWALQQWALQQRALQQWALQQRALEKCAPP